LEQSTKPSTLALLLIFAWLMIPGEQREPGFDRRPHEAGVHYPRESQ